MGENERFYGYGIEKNVTEKSDSRLTKTVTTDTGDAGIIKKVVTGKKNTEVSLPAEIVPPATDDSNLIENDSEKPEMMLVTEDGFIVDGTGTITGVADYEKAVKEGRHRQINAAKLRQPRLLMHRTESWKL